MKDGFVRATDPARPPPGLERAAYAIGNFDGLHLGHQAVIRRTIALAQERGAPSALLTFEPHPADHFAERPVAFGLTPPEMKAALCAELGLSGLVFLSFTAARGLGRPYAVSGRVIPGQRLGRSLGVPTANIALAPTNRLAHGVYAVRALVEGASYPAVASFGVRPTVDNGPPLLEVHLLDFDGDLYGRELTVEFVERIREERKFDSLDALVAEMERDKQRARAILARLT